jgi:ubiquinone/menaquinone biosynthesis C-methylase UbiE
MRRLPHVRAWLWRIGYDYLAAHFDQPSWVFMNYGFVPPEGVPKLAVVDADEQRSERQVEMYRQAIADVEVAGRDVLEVGSGRGGGAWYVTHYLKPHTMTAVDYSGRAVAFCQKRFTEPNLTFVEGSAEALPFADASFDLVVNVESSHCYPSMETFLSEVHRVLRPGGHLCIADFRSVADVQTLREQLTASGLTVVQDVDITSNVCASMDVGTKQYDLIASHMRPRIVRRPIRWFFGVQGTGIYDALHDGRSKYTRWVLQKPA